MAEILTTVGTTIGTKILETVVDQFLSVVIDAKDKAVQYTEILDRIQTTVNDIAPLVKQIERLNTSLDRPTSEVQALVDLLKGGQDLVKKCSEGIHWCCFKRTKYAGVLLNFEAELKRYYEEILPLQQTINQMEMMVKIDQIHAITPGVAGYGGCAVPEAPKFLVGFEVHLKDLKTHLLNRTDSRMIIVSAPGGCGKTTLIKKVCHDDEIKGHYGDRIYFVPVSKTLQVKVIVKRVLKGTNQAVSEFQSDEDAVNQLSQRLRRIATQGPILLVLDDVWSGHGAESFLEKIQFDIEGFRILVTSRVNFPRFDCSYDLTGLNDDDAKKLFCLAAGLQEEVPDELNEIVGKITKVCKGLPLPLVMIGRSLCGQKLPVWKEKEQQWFSGSSKFGSEFEKDIFECLRMSLDALKDDNPIKKSCFLDLSCFPEDHRIPVTALIDMWEELHGFDRDGVKAMATIYSLCQRNLASLTLVRGSADEVDNWHGAQFVTVHDLLRELAIEDGTDKRIGLTNRLIVSIVNGNFPSWWEEQEQHPKKAKLLSITTDDTFSSKWHNMEAPEAEALVLNFQSEKYTLPDFIGKLGKLKVLVATNYGFCPTELSNFHLISYPSSLRKIRLEHVSISCLGRHATRLDSLQRISFVMCKINEAFKNPNARLSDVFPNLEEINIDYCDDLVGLPDDLCKLTRLRRLIITGCHNLTSLPDGIGQLSSLEVLRLNACTSLTKLPDSIGSLLKLTVLDISDCFGIERLPNQMGNLRSLQKLYMMKCLNLQRLPESMGKLRQLKEVTCDEERANLWMRFERKPKIKIAHEDINLNWL